MATWKSTVENYGKMEFFWVEKDHLLRGWSNRSGKEAFRRIIIEFIDGL